MCRKLAAYATHFETCNYIPPYDEHETNSETAMKDFPVSSIAAFPDVDVAVTLRWFQNSASQPHATSHSLPLLLNHQTNLPLCVRPALPLCSCIRRPYLIPFALYPVHSLPWTIAIPAPDDRNPPRTEHRHTEANSTPRPRICRIPRPLAPPTSVRRRDVHTLRDISRPRPRPSSPSSVAQERPRLCACNDQLTVRLLPPILSFPDGHAPARAWWASDARPSAVVSTIPRCGRECGGGYADTGCEGSCREGGGGAG